MAEFIVYARVHIFLFSGNFLALLDFRVDAGDVVLENHLKNAARNATYTSKSIQNEIISNIGRSIQDQLVTDIQQNIFSLYWQMRPPTQATRNGYLWSFGMWIRLWI